MSELLSGGLFRTFKRGQSCAGILCRHHLAVFLLRDQSFPGRCVKRFPTAKSLFCINYHDALAPDSASGCVQC